MGYYTNYKITAYDKAGELDDKTLRSVLSVASKAGLTNLFNVIYEDGMSCKWYSHEEDMQEISLKFTNTLFKLHGEGETNSDIWDKYFLNGKMQVKRAEVKIPPYDPTWSE